MKNINRIIIIVAIFSSVQLAVFAQANSVSTTSNSNNNTVVTSNDIGVIPPLTDLTSDIPDLMFTDERINKYDLTAPIAVYPQTLDGETSLMIRDADGEELLVVTPQQIVIGLNNPDTDLIIATSDDITVAHINGSDYGITSAVWQITMLQDDGRSYVLIFSDLVPNAGYESFEITS